MSNEIVVGVKPIKDSAVVEVGEEAVASIGACWVTFDGKELPCKYEDGSIITSVKVDCDAGPLVVHLQLIASQFRTVHYQDPEHAPERFH